MENNKDTKHPDPTQLPVSSTNINYTRRDHVSEYRVRGGVLMDPAIIKVMVRSRSSITRNLELLIYSKVC